MKLTLIVAAAAAALSMAAGAWASFPAGTTKHDRDVIRFFSRHPGLARTPAGARAMWQVLGHLELRLRSLQTAHTARVSACGGASTAACTWYLDGATQCEVAHEGAFTTLSSYGYAGRFQMDQSFETATAFGRSMEARYGRASNWPPGAQIEHAYGQFTSRGWAPWPPYYKYGCSRFHGGTYR